MQNYLLFCDILFHTNMVAVFVLVYLPYRMVSLLFIKRTGAALSGQSHTRISPDSRLFFQRLHNRRAEMASAIFRENRHPPNDGFSLLFEQAAGGNGLAVIVKKGMAGRRIHAVKLVDKALFFHKNPPADVCRLRGHMIVYNTSNRHRKSPDL